MSNDAPKADATRALHDQPAAGPADTRAMIADAVESQRRREHATGPTATPRRAIAPQSRSHPALLIFGVILPAVVLVIEAVSGLCRRELFDPMPTLWHMALVAAVPTGNFLLLLHLAGRPVLGRRWIAFVNGAVTGIAGFYALLFLPLTPFALVAVLIGIGILPLSPLAAFLASIRIACHLNSRTGARGWTHAHFWGGIVAAALALVVVDLPLAATRLGIAYATSADAAVRERGIRMLRSFGSTDLLLELCYGRSQRPAGLFSVMIALSDNGLLGRPRPQTSTQEAREIYYRVTGKPFTVARMARTTEMPLTGRGVTFDRDIASTQVGGTVPGLSLTTSRLDGSLSADDAVAYIEWLFEVRNDGSGMSEARMSIALPPGAVVSRVTLWVNGVEEEAAFAGRAQVRAAYERVVRRAQDPFLVTTNGADRILAQAFPVMPNGGVMKFKIGITAPLELESSGEKTRLVLPAIVDRNFAVGDDVRHGIWLESKQPLAIAGMTHGLVVTGIDGGSRIAGEISDRGLATARPVIQLDRDAAHITSTAMNPETGSAVQEIIAPRPLTPRTLMLVVDASAAARPHTLPILAALDQLPAGAAVGLALADDRGTVIAPAPMSPDIKVRFKAAVEAASFVGGIDNTQALIAAMTTLAGDRDGHIIWIHGPQPVRFAGTKVRFEQMGERLRTLPSLHLYALEPGPNMMLSDAPWGGEARDIPATGNITADLARALRRITGIEPTPIIRRTLIVRPGLDQEPHMPPVITPAANGSSHIVRLAAHAEIQALVRQRKPTAHKMAVELAALHRLVTPVSGAVVLETQQQYREAGLTQGVKGEKGNVPTVPEPHEWALILLAALGLGWLLWQRAWGANVPTPSHRHLAGAS